MTRRTDNEKIENSNCTREEIEAEIYSEKTPRRSYLFAKSQLRQSTESGKNTVKSPKEVLPWWHTEEGKPNEIPGLNYGEPQLSISGNKTPPLSRRSSVELPSEQSTEAGKNEISVSEVEEKKIPPRISRKPSDFSDVLIQVEADGVMTNPHLSRSRSTGSFDLSSNHSNPPQKSQPTTPVLKEFTMSSSVDEVSHEASHTVAVTSSPASEHDAKISEGVKMPEKIDATPSKDASPSSEQESKKESGPSNNSPAINQNVSSQENGSSNNSPAVNQNVSSQENDSKLPPTLAIIAKERCRVHMPSYFANNYLPGKITGDKASQKTLRPSPIGTHCYLYLSNKLDTDITSQTNSVGEKSSENTKEEREKQQFNF